MIENYKKNSSGEAFLEWNGGEGVLNGGKGDTRRYFFLFSSVYLVLII
jgi:hypothetical protein